MIRAVCIDKIKDKNGKISEYKLKDTNNNIIEIDSNTLKKELKLNNINVSNLKLTKNNRLIQTSTKTEQEYDKVNNVLVKAKLLNLPIKQVNTSSGQYAHIINTAENSFIMVIPDNVTVLNRIQIYGMDKSLKIVGGRNLIRIENAFRILHLNKLDLSELDTSNVIYMNSAFEDAVIKELIIGEMNTSNVKDMSFMFSGIKTNNLKLPFNTSNVVDMRAMFYNVKVNKLDISTFDTSNTKVMRAMFRGIKIDTLDISHFKTDKLIDISYMFAESKINNLTLGNFNIDNIEMKDNFMT